MQSTSSANGPSIELAWAAGFLDGEGCFSTMTNRRGKVRNYPLLTISQRERYVLDRFMKAVGEGYVNGPYNKDKGAGAYYYRVNGYEKVLRVAKLLWPYLSPVKRAQARRVLAAYRAVH